MKFLKKLFTQIYILRCLNDFPIATSNMKL